MRKDVRTGAAIGGIMLAALVVYGVVTHRHNRDATKIVLDTGKSAHANNNAAGGTDQSAAPTDPGSSADTSTHGGPITPPPAGDPNRSTVGSPVPANPINDVVIGSGNAYTPAPVPTGNGSRTATWAILLSADNAEDLIKPSQVASVRGDGTTVRTPAPADDSTMRAHRTTETGNPRRAPLTATTESGQSGNAGGSSETPDHPSAASKTHRVVEGETFSSIARATYGDAKYFKEIIKANPNIDPSRLRPGTVISLPDKSQFKHDAAPTTRPSSPDRTPRRAVPSASINPKTEYRVQSNDNLYKISMKLYHNANHIDAIYQLNKSTIGPDPEKLKLDMVLKLPEPPAEAPSH